MKDETIVQCGCVICTRARNKTMRAEAHDALEVSNYTATSPDDVLSAIRRQLKIAQAVWPSLLGVQIVGKNLTDTDNTQSSQEVASTSK